MTTSTKARPKPAAPKPKAPAKPAEAKAPEAPTPAPKPRGGNSAYAAESVRNQIRDAMKDLESKGFTRPSISAVTGFNDSTVWRAHNYKVHTDEVPVFMDFIAKVVAGEVKPPTSGRKPKVDDLQARVAEAIDVLGNEAKTAAQYRKIVDAALEILADVVPAVAEPEVPAEAEVKTDA